MQQVHGDLEVSRAGFGMERVTVKEVKLAHVAILKNKETKPRFSSWFMDDPQRVGEPVLRID